MNQQKQPPGEKKSEPKLALLDTAAKYFLTDGYNGTGLQKILDKSGIPKGSFYYYFKSKEDFGAQVVSYYWESVSSQIRQCLLHSGGNPAERIRRYLDSVIALESDSGCRHGCLLTEMASEMADLSPLIQSALQSAFQQWVAILAQVIRDGQTAGLFTRKKEADALARLFLALWQGAVLQMKILGITEPLTASRDYLMDVLLVE